ncbi:peptide/nickel transport system substrate-binding protein [Nocardia transvalensis]|uniref:Peptide/nickel transport system substrate-binding protein n=1 Tax=Nocardia transvalensis TaxID=37333 RepID=A0A7W9PCN1_9NOCA|nr:ABC transporter family substrate-binding protein [Nocardia transvalensis]MBB5913677.1 peptide/nickel transport system substrate-binding protein [Nocardia transvalensis]
MIRSTVSRLAIPAVALGLILSGCSSDTGTTGGDSSIGTTNDINPRDPSELRDGGTLRLSLGGFPSNFNYLHIDGTNEYTSDVIEPLLPSAVISDAAGEISVDHNYFTDIKLTGTNPQQVTYTINPKAEWSDGKPITWEDLKSQAHALSGADGGYLISSPQGFDRVASVDRGVDDRQAVVTFSRPYAEWEGQFSPIYPKSVTESPDAFNNSVRDNLPITSGPFVITNIDRTQNRITLGRNPSWWGDRPKLDTITYSVLDSSAEVAAIQNNEIDYTAVGGLSNVTIARNTPGVAVRRAPAPGFNVLTFNGAPGAILSDVALRRAIAKTINRQALAETWHQGVLDNPKPLNNHIFMEGQKGNQDNSGDIRFDPDQAARELDALGWTLNGDVREKDGRKLELRDVMYQYDPWVDVAKIIQQDMARVGVKLNIETVRGQGLFSDVINPGKFDLVQHGWSGGVFPLGALEQIYAWNPDNPQSNHARVGTPELNALIEQTVSEVDPDKARELANRCDVMIWNEVHSLPLFQGAGNYAVRADLANLGAFGLASKDWTKVGFLK